MPRHILADWAGRSQPGFTLVELLVVITIIVVLLALLVPAVDHALYQAELAVCGSQMKGVVSGVQVYAADHRRAYPVNKLIEAGQSVQPFNLTDGSGNEARDNRTHVMPYINLQALVDPLCTPVRLDPASNHSGTNAFASYNLWYGWRIKGFKGMRRIGDRWEWSAMDRNGRAVAAAFPWLMTDRDMILDNPAIAIGVNNSHPDSDGVMKNVAIGNEFDRSVDRPVALVALTQFNRIAISLWIAWGTMQRGTVEMNAAADDGSVSRLNRVARESDKRVIPIPENSDNTSWPNNFGHVPAP
jgi:prepilin-type N-terminal cleavage/methylation domain-containing protein